MARNKRTNPVTLRRGMSIGTGSAESDDDLLFSCFVHYPPLEECLKIPSSGMVLAGRTGAGKTAIFRYIEEDQKNTADIDPAEMSMNYVANSDALRFLNAIGADLDLLFQVLWKHVLCIEFIRLRWRVDSEAKSRTVFDRITSRFQRDERKSRAVAYLREWEGKFWITMDQNIKEITETVENKLHPELGGEIGKFKAGGQYDKRLSLEKKSELVARARSIVNADQLRELHGVIEMLADASAQDDMNRCYLLIDRLDENWVDESIRFRLIRALVASLKSFKAIRNLKILVGLRADVVERVMQETGDITFQREKFEDQFIKIVWTSEELRKLVNTRMRTVFRRQYTGHDIEFHDVFTHNVKGKDAFEYLVERTHMRPRDIIAFVNECFSASDGQTEIAPKHIEQAEYEYSRKRRDALEQEWRSAFPSLGHMLKMVTARKALATSVGDLQVGDELEEMALNICAGARAPNDTVFDLAQSVMDDKPGSKANLTKAVSAILYRVGAVGLKLRAEERYLYSESDDPVIGAELIGADAKLRIHPMLHGAYRLNDLSRGRGPRAGNTPP